MMKLKEIYLPSRGTQEFIPAGEKIDRQAIEIGKQILAAAKNEAFQAGKPYMVRDFADKLVNKFMNGVQAAIDNKMNFGTITKKA